MGEIEDFKKVTGPRKHKIRNSLGVYDAYKWIRKNKWLNIGQPITEHQFYVIIRRVHEAMVEDLLKGKKITLPYSLGNIELRKFPRKISFENGKLETNLPIDWGRTLKLWAEEGKSKTLIRAEYTELFNVYYNKKTANYTNKGFFSFLLNRDARKFLHKKIKNKQIDAYIDD